MFDTLMRTLSWQDILQVSVIVIVLLAISPYGVFLARTLIAYRNGTPMPYMRRRNSSGGILEEVVNDANRQLDEAHRTAGDLARQLSEAQDEIDRLSRENDALRDALRDRRGEFRDQAGPSANHEEAGSPLPPDILDALAVLWLSGPPLPQWDAIRAAYREAARIHHPDRGGEPEDMKRVNAAYDLLREHCGK